MAFDVHYMDKLSPGLHHSVSIRSKAGKPKGLVKLGSTELPLVVERLDTDLWKIRFLLPKDAKGELEMTFEAGSHRSSEKKPIG